VPTTHRTGVANAAGVIGSGGGHGTTHRTGDAHRTSNTDRTRDTDPTSSNTDRTGGTTAVTTGATDRTGDAHRTSNTDRTGDAHRTSNADRASGADSVVGQLCNKLGDRHWLRCDVGGYSVLRASALGRETGFTFVCNLNIIAAASRHHCQPASYDTPDSRAAFLLVAP
jgi:hypothetical protein